MGNDWLLIGFAAFVLTGTGLAAALAAGERKSLPIAVQASSIWGGPSSSSVRSPIPRQGFFANS